MNATERKEWLAQRREGITATDMARLVCPFKEPEGHKISLEKLGLMPDTEPELLLQIGLATEEVNAAAYTKRTGQALLPGSFVTAESWMMATPDRLRERDLSPVELKYVSSDFTSKWGDEFTDVVPMRYTVQVTWQMACTGSQTSDLSAINARGEHRIYRIPFDAELADLLKSIGDDFRKMLAKGVAIDPLWQHPLAEKVGGHCYRVESDKTLVLNGDTEAKAKELTDLKALKKQVEEQIEERSEALKALMGDANKAVAGNFVLSRTLIEGGKPVSYTTKPYVRFDCRPAKGAKS